MSEPEVEWYINCIKTQLEEIDRLISEKILTNSIREIISFNINKIQINLYTIIRKLKKEDK